MFKSAFDKLHDYYKTHDAIAAAYKVTRQNITLWKKNGIPANRALEIENKTGGKVTAMDVLRG
jgi:hypothetical protein